MNAFRAALLTIIALVIVGLIISLVLKLVRRSQRLDKTPIIVALVFGIAIAALGLMQEVGRG